MVRFVANFLDANAYNDDKKITNPTIDPITAPPIVKTSELKKMIMYITVKTGPVF